MIGWILTIIATIIGIGLLIYGINATGGHFSHKEDFFLLGIGILLAVIVFMSIATYNNRITIPEEYKYITTTIKETQALINTDRLNLADMQMHRQLADLIKERNELLLKVRINNKSPFAYYKIVLD